MGLLMVYKAHLPLCDPKFNEISRSRKNQLDFFTLDHEKLFSISRYRLETLDCKKDILVLVSNHRIERKNSCSRLKNEISI